jgi:plasmid maintenance system antidote protein VapI
MHATYVLGHNLGETHGAHKLTESDVIDARILSCFGASSEELARVMGVTRGAISKAVSRKTWRHVP